MTDTADDSETPQTPSAAAPDNPADAAPAAAARREAGAESERSGNLLTRILVPAYLVVLILVFTDVLLITWPMTHADESVACLSASDRGRNRGPFSAIDNIVHDLVQYCPDKTGTNASAIAKPTDGPPLVKQQDDGATLPSGAADPGTNPDGDPPGPGDNENNNSNEGGDGGDEDGKPPKPSKNTVPRQGNALFLAVLSAGMIGGAVYSLRAHTVHIAVGNYQASWWQWNVTRPFLSGALAILFFFLVRAGFVENGAANTLRPEGFIAIGGLVGLFTDQAWAKIRQVANATFAEADHGAETARTTPVIPPTPTETPSSTAGPAPGTRPTAS